MLRFCSFPESLLVSKRIQFFLCSVMEKDVGQQENNDAVVNQPKKLPYRYTKVTRRICRNFMGKLCTILLFNAT